MRDFFGNDIQKYDHVIVMFHAHTTSALVLGLVTSVKPDSIRYKVLKSGYQAQYGNRASVGDVKLCTTPEKIVDLDYDRPFD